MPAQYLVPGIVAHRPHELGGLDDVREDECAGRLRARRLIGTACDAELHQESGSQLLVDRGAQPAEGRPGGLQFQHRPVGVSPTSVRGC